MQLFIFSEHHILAPLTSLAPPYCGANSTLTYIYVVPSPLWTSVQAPIQLKTVPISLDTVKYEINT